MRIKIRKVKNLEPYLKNINRQKLNIDKRKSFLRSYNKEIGIIKKYVYDRLNMDDIERIRVRFDLSKCWEYPLVEYILTNKMPKPNFDPDIRFLDSPHKANRRLTIEVFGNTTPNDIVKMFPRIKHFLKYLPDYNIRNIREKMTLKIGEYLETLFEGGLKGKALANKAKKQYPHLEFEPELIRKYRERYKKNRDRRTG